MVKLMVLELLTPTHLVDNVQELQEDGCEGGHRRGRGVASIVREAMAKGEPIFLDEQRETFDGAIVGI